MRINQVNNNINFGKISWGTPKQRQATSDAFAMVHRYNNKKKDFVTFSDISAVLEPLKKEKDVYLVSAKYRSDLRVQDSFEISIYNNGKLLDGVEVSLSNGATFPRNKELSTLGQSAIEKNKEIKENLNISKSVEKFMNKFAE